MKKVWLFFFVISFLIASCNKISDKPVSEKLSTDELSKAIKSDTLFADFYEEIRKEVDDMSDIKKATYNDVTYRRLFQYVKFLRFSLHIFIFFRPLSPNIPLLHVSKGNRSYRLICFR